MPDSDTPLREHDVVGHQQQARDHCVEPRRHIGEEAVGEPEPEQADGEDRQRDLQLDRSGAQQIKHVRKEPRARTGVRIDVGMRGGIVRERLVGQSGAVGDAVFIKIAGVPIRRKEFVVVECEGQEIGIYEHAAEDGDIRKNDDEPCDVELRELLHGISVRPMLARWPDIASLRNCEGGDIYRP